MTIADDPPPGFARHTRTSPVTDPWEPLYARRSESGAVEIGVRLARAHCNARGTAHGGVIAALADNAMGLTYAVALPATNGVLTVSLAVDYVATGQIGAWVQVSPRLIRCGKNTGFVDCLVTADDAIIARASATFRSAS